MWSCCLSLPAVIAETLSNTDVPDLNTEQMTFGGPSVPGYHYDTDTRELIDGRLLSLGHSTPRADWFTFGTQPKVMNSW